MDPDFSSLPPPILSMDDLDSNASVLCGQSLALNIPPTWTPDLSAQLQHIVVLNLSFSKLQDVTEPIAQGVPDSPQDGVRSAAVLQTQYAKQLLESKGMFTNHASDEVLVSPDSVGNIDPLHHDLGWSFSDSACSLFSSLAADRTFYHHFHSCRTQHPMAFATLNGLADADFSSSHTATYVHSKILPNACGSIEHMNIMYWTDRFHLCESEQDALAYDEAKKSEHRTLIWPYFRSVYNDVNGFCSSLSLYIFQSYARDIALDPAVVSQNVQDYVHSLVYARCMKLCTQVDDDTILSAQCKRFKLLSLDDIGLDPKLQSSSSQPFLSSIRLLQDIVSVTSPRSKLALILDCSRNITQELQSIFTAADPSDSVYLTADEFLSVFNYVLIQADVSTLASQLCYIRHFSSKNALFGESGYFLTTLEAATSWLKDLNDETLAAFKKL